jgi:hypothetical protein
MGRDHHSLMDQRARKGFCKLSYPVPVTVLDRDATSIVARLEGHQRVPLFGAPGVGKSTLVAELLVLVFQALFLRVDGRRMRGHAWTSSRCASWMQDAVGFH